MARWVKRFTCTVHKEGERSDFKDYRNTSLLFVANTILASIIINAYKYGYMHGKSKSSLTDRSLSRPMSITSTFTIDFREAYEVEVFEKIYIYLVYEVTSKKDMTLELKRKLILANRSLRSSQLSRKTVQRRRLVVEIHQTKLKSLRI